MGRLILYTFKGNFDYAFGQFEFTLFLKNLFLHAAHSGNSGERKKAVVFDLQTGAERYHFNLFNLYRLSDYDLYLKPNYSFYSTLEGLYSKEIFTFLKPGFNLSFRDSEKYDHVHLVTDKKLKRNSPKFNKHIYISFQEAFNPLQPKIPFGFHPLVYCKNELIDYKSYRAFLSGSENQIKHSKIFFGGSSSHKMYDKLNYNFPSLINRNIVFQILKDTFASNIKLEKIGNEEIFLLEGGNFQISPTKWFQILRGSYFFIAPPGFEMPFSHNIFEAMGCGLIPIVQYGNLLFPPLKHQVNCLKYNSEEELLACINMALNMAAMERDSMINEVKKYYIENIDPKSFLQKIEKSPCYDQTFTCVAGSYSLGKNL